MQVKFKKCKGIGKASNFAGCGTVVLVRKYGLCPHCYSTFLYSTVEGLAIVANATLIGKKRFQKQSDQRKRQKKDVAKEKIKTLSQYESDAKKSFQHYVRLRDKDLPCISCGNPKPADWCGSHYFPAGLYSGLMFDERNCHGACNTYCNKYLSGNLIGYRKGLIQRYGVDFVDKLESESDEKRNHKFTKQELIDLKKKYDEKIKNNNY